MSNYQGQEVGFNIRCILDSSASGGNFEVPSYLNMQDFTSADASSMALKDHVTLKDNRDNQLYTVAKLEDGNVWMLDNLNLGNIDLWVDLDGSNTNLTGTLSKDTFNSWRNNLNIYTLDSPGSFTFAPGADSVSGGAFGTLYNYCATSANTNCASELLSDTTNDICPKGWKLPSDLDLLKLYNKGYDTVSKMRSPIAGGGLGVAFAGAFNATTTGTITGQDGGVAYWSSKSADSSRVKTMYINTSQINPEQYEGRGIGYSIRCIQNKTKSRHSKITPRHHLGVFYRRRFKKCNPSLLRTLGLSRHYQ